MNRTGSFGAWLKHRRLSLGHTQAVLAASAGCSLVTLRKIEADERRPSAQVAARLAACLNLPAALHTSFVACARGALAADRLPPPETLDDERPPLPASPTALIGRDVDVAVCAGLLAEGTRLLTIIGPPGIGKTRLALALAHALAPGYRDDALFVPLAPLSDPALVAGALALALGVRENGRQPLVEGIAAFLRAKQTLLVLDNFEQLLEAAPLLGALLEAAPGLTVIATSRAPLRIAAEHLYALAPLGEGAAMELFVARARAVRHGFARTAANAPVLTAIVRRLDGLPLAIELAAARVRRFPPDALLARLEAQGLGALVDGPRDAPERQRTLHACIAWSYALLGEAEQALFRRLAVFVGGFTQEAAAAVGVAEEVLAALLDQSLVAPIDSVGGEPRYMMLELVRAFALERLREAGEEEAARRAHAECCVALAEQICGDDGFEHWDERTVAEYPNFRAALEWSRTAGVGGVPDAEIGLRLAKTLRIFWYTAARQAEGLAWLEELCSPAWARGPKRWRMLLLSSLGQFRATVDGHDPRAYEALEQGLALARELGDLIATAELTRHLGELLLFQNKPDEADPWFAESLQAAEMAGNMWNIGWTKQDLGLLAEARGEYTLAREIYLECRDIFKTHFSISDTANTRLGELAWRLGEATEAARWFHAELVCGTNAGDPSQMASAHDGLGKTAYLVGDYPLAERHYAEAIQLELSQPHCDPAFICYVLRGVAATRVGTAELVNAAQLFGHSLAHDTPPGCFRIPSLDYTRPAHDRALAACRAALGDDAFAAAWEAGRAMTLDEAVALALASPQPV